MDPLAIQAAQSTGWTRPVGASSSQLATALQLGRVFSGDVLQTLGGGSILVGVGALRVPARSQTELEPGRRYLFEVVRAGTTVELKVLSQLAAPEGELMQALRRALGAEAPPGELLGELTRALQAALVEARAAGGAAAEASALEWLGGLEARALQVGEAPEALRAKLLGAGLAFEARIAHQVLDFAPAAEVSRVAAELLAAVAARARTIALAVGDDFDHEGVLRRWGEALSQILRAAGDAAPERPPASPPPDLERGVLASLERLPPAQASALRAALEALAWERWPSWMRRLVGGALGGEAWRPVARDARLAARSLGERDLKAYLLALESRSPSGPLREAVARALAGLEADQLLNLARAAADEPAVWSAALQTAQGWSTLLLRVADGRAGRGRDADAAGGLRATLEVEFSAIGPVRVDLLLAESSTTARVLAASEDVTRLLRDRASELEQSLSFRGSRAHARVARAQDSEELHTEAPARSSYFDAQHLMDLEG